MTCRVVLTVLTVVELAVFVLEVVFSVPSVWSVM